MLEHSLSSTERRHSNRRVCATENGNVYHPQSTPIRANMHDLTHARTRKEKAQQKSVCYRKCKRLPSTEYNGCRAKTHDLTPARTHENKAKHYLRSIRMILHYVSAMLAKGPFAIQVASWHHNERPKYGADGQVILTCNHPVTRRRKV